MKKTWIAVMALLLAFCMVFAGCDNGDDTDTGTSGTSGTTEKVQDSESKGDGEVTACTHEETEIRNAVAPTKSADGYTGDTYCKKCNEKLSEGESITRLSLVAQLTAAENYEDAVNRLFALYLPETDSEKKAPNAIEFKADAVLAGMGGTSVDITLRIAQIKGENVITLAADLEKIPQLGNMTMAGIYRNGVLSMVGETDEGGASAILLNVDAMIPMEYGELVEAIRTVVEEQINPQVEAVLGNLRTTLGNEEMSGILDSLLGEQAGSVTVALDTIDTVYAGFMEELGCETAITAKPSVQLPEMSFSDLLGMIMVMYPGEVVDGATVYSFDAAEILDALRGAVSMLIELQDETLINVIYLFLAPADDSSEASVPTWENVKTMLKDQIKGDTKLEVFFKALEEQVKELGLTMDDVYTMALEIVKSMGVEEVPTVEDVKASVETISQLTLDDLARRIGFENVSGMLDFVFSYLENTKLGDLVVMSDSRFDSEAYEAAVNAFEEEYERNYPKREDYASDEEYKIACEEADAYYYKNYPQDEDYVVTTETRVRDILPIVKGILDLNIQFNAKFTVNADFSFKSEVHVSVDEIFAANVSVEYLYIDETAVSVEVGELSIAYGEDGKLTITCGEESKEFTAEELDALAEADEVTIVEFEGTVEETVEDVAA